jgi:hypothetical protein
MQTKRLVLNFDLPVNVPTTLDMTMEEKEAMTLRAAEFIMWEMNELVQRKTGIIQWFGITPLQAQHEGERDNAI